MFKAPQRRVPKAAIIEAEPTKFDKSDSRAILDALKALKKSVSEKPLFLATTRRYIPMKHRALAEVLSGPDHPGIPTGVYIEVLGAEHSGKTTLTFAFIDAVINQPPDTLHSVRTDKGIVQKLAPRRVFYADFEHALDKDYLAASVPNVVFAETDENGVLLNPDEANVYVHQPDLLEEGVEVMIQLINTGLFGLVINDSIPAMLPKEEAEKSMMQSTMGKHALAMGKLFRRTTHVLTKHNATVLLINQWRDKIGVVFGDPRTAPGGKATRYFNAVRLDVSGPKGSKWFPDGGKVCKIKCMKNKVWGKLTTCEYQLGRGVGISAEVELTKALASVGLVSYRSLGKPVVLKYKGATTKFKNVEEWFVYLRKSNSRFFELIRAAKIAGAQFGTIEPKVGFGED